MKNEKDNMTLTCTNSLDAASGVCDSCVIFLHGYGASGNDLIGLAPYFARYLPNTVFLSPDAPQVCSINPAGFQWFPLSWIDGSSQVQMEQSFFNTLPVLENMIDEVAKDYSLQPNRIVLVGFSQGTMVALHFGLRFHSKLSGIIGFSGRLLFPELLESELKQKPEVLLVHGDKDDVVDCAETHTAEKYLKQQGILVEKHISKNVPHSIAPDGLQMAIQSVRKWLR
jgi:phospholipase/carboxylesterase